MKRQKTTAMIPRAAQATLEFVFAFIVLVVIFYGCVKTLQWLGVVLISPVNKHYQGLYSWSGTLNAGSASYNYVQQLNSGDVRLPSLRIVFPGQLFNSP
jgi:uncharacterized protein (UPF0333 family)